MQKLSNVKRMNIWTVIRTILDRNPGIRAKELVKKAREKTDLGRSTIYSHLGSLHLKGEIHREKGRYWLPEQKRMTDQVDSAYPAPKIHYEITQKIRNNPHLQRQLPDVGFTIVNPNGYPVRVKVEARIILGGRNLGLIQGRKGYYSGETPWNVNPAKIAWGHFSVPKECVDSAEELTIEIRATIIDPNHREHRQLPESWTYIRKHNTWYFEPRAFTNGK